MNILHSSFWPSKRQLVSMSMLIAFSAKKLVFHPFFIIFVLFKEEKDIVTVLVSTGGISSLLCKCPLQMIYCLIFSFIEGRPHLFQPFMKDKKYTIYNSYFPLYTRWFPMGQLIETQLIGTQLIGVNKLRVN